MRIKKFILFLLVAAVLAGCGWNIYQLGLKDGQAQTATPQTDKSAEGTTVDPSAWGIPEGEEATKRHIKAGLKGGEIDPLTGRQILYYHDPMMPGKKFEVPGKSPFMDMMLIPAYAGTAGTDLSTVSVSPRIQQNLGLRTTVVVSGQLGSDVSAVGSVAWNERGQFVIQARATGYVEKLHMDAVLDSVNRNQPLLDIYVPDWVAVQEDYLTTRRMQGTGLLTLVEAARQRMRLAGMNELQIALVENTGKVQPRSTLIASNAGIVTELMVREGSTVTTGMPLLRINDLSSVWVHAEVPESLVTQVTVGAQMTAQTSSLPGEIFQGQVQSLLPEVEPATRTRKVRMTLANPDAKLVPGMFVHMKISVERASSVLLVPSESLVRTGKRTLVITVDDDGAFRPVEVKVGHEQNNQAEILSGLTEGQKIVLSGQFLIDSEANLKGVEVRLSSLKEHPPMHILQQTYRTTARVEAVNGDIVTLTHPEIPALQWPGMTMDFKLAPQVSRNLMADNHYNIEFLLQEGAAPVIIHWQVNVNHSVGDKQ